MTRALVVCSDCSPGICRSDATQRNRRKVPTSHLRWREITAEIARATGTHAERRLLRELETYLRSATMTQNVGSNSVYIVSLGGGRPDWSTISWRDVVTLHGKYFHPIGSTWPKDPPNYIGFRFDGILQRIHHVDDSVVVNDLHDAFSEITPRRLVGPHFVHTLGPAIVPATTVKLGKLYPRGRHYAAIDLLLTSQTVYDRRRRDQEATRKVRIGYLSPVQPP